MIRKPSTIKLSLEEIYNLANKTLLVNGCDKKNANAVAKTVYTAERDGSVSHGLFRIPGYVASLKSKKVNGKSTPKTIKLSRNIISVDSKKGFAPLSINIGIPKLVEVANKYGVGILAIKNTYHFAALWPETEALAEKNLVGIACTSTNPFVAPAGATKSLFGTNPISFAWPRPGKKPVVFDMATSTKAMGEVGVAARDGHKVPLGTGLNKKGKLTNNPSEIVNGGVLLPFGGYKGSAISMMIELLSAGLIGDNFSFEAKEKDNRDGGPTGGGEFILAMSPKIISSKNWKNHSEKFFKKMTSLKGVKLPGQRRYKNRLSTKLRTVNKELFLKIQKLAI